MQEFGVGWIPRWALARPGPWGNQCEEMEGLMRAYVKWLLWSPSRLEKEKKQEELTG